MLIHCSSFAARWIAFSAVALLICAELSSASARPRPKAMFFRGDGVHRQAHRL